MMKAVFFDLYHTLVRYEPPREDLEAEGDAAVERRLIEDNLNRRQLSPLARARSVLGLYELEKGRSKADLSPGEKDDARDRIGKLIGMSGKNLERYWAILKMPTEIQMAVERGLPMTLALKLVRKPKTQRKVARRIREGEDARAALVACLAAVPQKSTSRGPAVSTFLRLIGKANEALAEQDLDGFWKTPKAGQAESLNECKQWIDQILAAFQEGKKFRRKYGKKRPREDED